MFILSSNLVQASCDNALKLCVAITNGLGIRCFIAESRSQAIDYENHLKIIGHRDIAKKYCENRSSDALYDVSCGLFVGAAVTAGYEYATGYTGLPYIPETLLVAGHLSSVYYYLQNDTARTKAVSEVSRINRYMKFH